MFCLILPDSNFDIAVFQHVLYKDHYNDTILWNKTIVNNTASLKLWNVPLKPKFWSLEDLKIFNSHEVLSKNTWWELNEDLPKLRETPKINHNQLKSHSTNKFHSKPSSNTPDIRLHYVWCIMQSLIQLVLLDSR